MTKLLKSPSWLPIISVICLTIPGFLLRVLHLELYPPLTALITAVAIFSASFLLTWVCEVMQLDMPQALAITLVALIAVLPEYAVDMYFTYMAGKHPESEYVHYAIANMTGSNRLLIGIGWSLIILLYVFKFKHKVLLERTHRTEIFFLLIATLYALTIPLTGSLTLFDAAIFFAIFIVYLILILRKPVEEEEIEGPARVIAALPKKKRLITVWALFIVAAGVIFADAELFSESLVATGRIFGVNEFLLVQWLAPIASEAPEFIVAITFALRGQASLALGSLVASKLNQWTLLVGMIPIVFSISSNSTAPIPFGEYQMNELLLTASQSFFAIALIAGLVAGKKEALFLFILFILQFLSPFYDKALPQVLNVSPHSQVLILFSILYLTLGLILIIMHPGKIWSVIKGFNDK